MYKIHTMLSLDQYTGFEWDKGNIDKSHQKHGITPNEAEESFLDDFEIISYWHEEFNLVIRDCNTNNDFSRGYYIEPHLKDKFIYEQSIRRKLADFINEFTQN